MDGENEVEQNSGEMTDEKAAEFVMGVQQSAGPALTEEEHEQLGAARDHLLEES